MPVQAGIQPAPPPQVVDAGSIRLADDDTAGCFAMLRSATHERDAQGRAQGGPHAQARLRRGRAPAGLAQGPGQFRHRGRPPRRADPARGARARAPRLRLSGRGRRHARGRRQDPSLDRRSARRHDELPARHSAFRDLDRARARGHDRRRRGLQSGQRRAVHRRARQGRLPQRPAAAGRRRASCSPTPSSPAPCPIPAAAMSSAPRRSTTPRRARSRACAASAPPRSISPGSRPAASMPTGSAASRPGTSRPASSWCARPAATSPISTAANPCSQPATSWPATR